MGVHSERVNTMVDNKGSKGKGIVAAVVAIGSAAATQAKAQGTVSDVAQIAPATVNKYVQLSAAPMATIAIAPNDEVQCTFNKRAMVVALYILVCERLGVKPSANNERAIALTGRLLPYTNAGYSKAKTHMLKGSEVTNSGMRGYAKFVTKPDGVKLYSTDEGKAKVNQCNKLAMHIIATYGSVEGIDTAKQVLASK